MLTQVAVVGVCLSLLPLALMLLVKLRLFPLALYILLANTVLADWVRSHETASVAVFYAIAALIALSWVLPAIRRKLDTRRQVRALLRQVEAARAQGIPDPSFRRENGRFVLVRDKE